MKTKEVFYSPHRVQGFQVPLLDEKGQKIPVKDASGSVLYRKGKPVYQEREEQFSPMIEYRTGAFEPLCYYETPFKDGKPEDEEKYKVLCRLADDPSTKVMREADFKAKRNPEAWAREQELEAAHKELADLKAKDYEKEDALKRMQAEAEKLRRELERATKPGGNK